LSFVRRPRPVAIAAVLATTTLWVFVRDTHMLLVLVTALIVAFWAALPGPRLGRVVLLIGLVAIAGASYASTNSEAASLRRRQRILLHVVGQRVLTDHEATAWFRAHGMPAPSPRVRANSTRLAALVEDRPTDPETDAFLDWVADHGRVTLASYLVTHPAYALEPLLTERDVLIDAVPGYRVRGVRLVFPPAEVAYVRSSSAVFALLGVTVVGGAVTARVAGAARWWIVPTAGLAMQVPHAVVVWHGDTLDVARHALVLGLSLRLCALLLALFAVSAWLDWRDGPSSRMVPP
jgi:hypothetical protein